MSEAGLPGEALAFFSGLFGLIDLFLDLFFVDVVAAVPGVTFPSWLYENKSILLSTFVGM